MGTIRIISDPENVYQAGSIHSVKEIIRDYTVCCSDQSLSDYVWRIPIPDAIRFIADAWGLEYEFI